MKSKDSVSTNSKESNNSILSRGAKKVDFKQFAFAFVVLLISSVIPFIVKFVDTITIFIVGILSSDKRGRYTLEEVMTQDYNQPMNLAAIMFFTYLLYVLIFGLLYHKAIKDQTRYEHQHEAKLKLGMLFTSPCAYILIICGYLGQLFVDCALNIAQNIIPDAFEEYNKMMTQTVGASSSWLMLLTVFLISPIGEEFLFRGLIQGLLTKSVTEPDSDEELGKGFTAVIIIAQALCFAAYHGNLIQASYAFLLGAVLGYIAYKSKSLIPGMLFHIAINSSTKLVVSGWFENMTICIVLLVISLILFVVGIIWYVKCLKKLPAIDEYEMDVEAKKARKKGAK